MSHRPSAALAAVALAAAIGLPALAAAPATAAATTLYVNNNTTAHCSDKGTGTAAQPYCTVSAAAAVVLPGQTVRIAPGQGYNEELDITRSGTAAAPITFEGVQADPDSDDNYAVSLGNTFTGPQQQIPYAVKVDGAQHIVVQGLSLMADDANVRVQNSSDVVIRNNSSMSVSGDSAQFQIAGTSSGVTVTQNQFQDAGALGIDVAAGATGTVLSSNLIPTSGKNSITVTDAPGTVVTGNTLMSGCAPALVLAGASTGATVENNVIEAAQYESAPAQPCPAGSKDTGITVAAGSTSGTKVAYNDIDPKSGGPAYSWAGTSYSTVAAFAAASHQGSHDLLADPLIAGDNGYPLSRTSPVVDSADANAPGETATDVIGDPRVNVRTVPNTGTGSGFYDRGAQEFTGVGSSFTTVAPVRVLDTRAAIGVKTTVPVAPGATVTLPLAGTHGIPTDTANLGVVLNVTAADTKAAGHLSVYSQYDGIQPGGLPLSTLNWSKGQVIASLVTVPISQNSVSFTNHSTGTVSIVADLSGYYAMNGDSGFSSLPPTRILDTRSAKGVSTRTPVPAGGTVSLKVTGVGGVPASNVTAVVLNVTATGPTASTYVSVYPAGQSRPTVSNLNLSAGQTLPNQVIVPVGTGGKVTFYNHSGSVHLVADVAGYYSPNAVQTFHPSDGYNFLDTRTALGVPTTTPLGAGKSIAVAPLDSVYVNQGDKVSSVVLNMTAFQSTAASFLSVYPHGTALPTASNLNWARGQAVSNQVMVPVGSDGKLSLYNHTGTVELIGDYAGYFAP
ncbi:right-handed parallel beta-helix repeat-containing protein [Streptacidiphilus cavernicola]|uniref:Right-handed parallel beta-helix repeat-containing protein n=1 Tax=Streptacidiphilus cavernicola TaxID=3342716 RepID=A0ABV6VW00_9ACTN